MLAAAATEAAVEGGSGGLALKNCVRQSLNAAELEDKLRETQQKVLQLTGESKALRNERALYEAQVKNLNAQVNSLGAQISSLSAQKEEEMRRLESRMREE